MKNYNNVELSKKKNPDEKITSVIVGIVLCLFLVNLFSGLGLNANLVSNLSKGVILILIVYSLNSFISRIDYKIVFSIIITMLVICFQLLLFPQNNAYFNQTLNVFFTTCLPAFLFILALRDYDLLLKKLVRCSYFIGIVSSCVFVADAVFSLKFFGDYAMGYSYACLLPILVIINDYFEKHNIWKLALIILSALNVVAFGSRGAVLCIGVFIILIFLKRCDSLRDKIIRLCIGVVLLILFLNFYQPVLIFVDEILRGFGIHSRTLTVFINNANYLGREDIYDSLLRHVINDPFTIRGINADFLLVNTYSHNIILEILVEFGFILGLVLLIALLFMVIKSIFINISSSYGKILLMVFSYAIPSLFFSNTLWRSMYFWMWIALLLNKQIVKKTAFDGDNNAEPGFKFINSKGASY